MDSVEKHIEHDKKILDDPLVSPQSRRHTEEELGALEKWVENHPNDHHDPSPLELYCDSNPEALECRIYEN
jgi:hypothetical protein